MLVSMGSKKVGEGQPLYIVLEAGPTHTGLESAIELANHAKVAGADAIKFQIADHNRLITTKDVLFSYGILKSRETGEIEQITEPLIDIWQRRFMPRDDWAHLKSHCDNIGIDFFATVFFEDDVDFLIDIGVHSLKIAAQDIEHEDLIRYCARKNVPLQIDTGSATIGEVERAVDWILSEGNENIIINHCPSGYPARLESINLNVIQTLKQMFPYPVAFSDHTPGWDMDIAARTKGADIIEKTITLDKTMRSCEHVMSLEPPEMQKFITAMHDLDLALGEGRRMISGEEDESRRHVRRSAFLVAPVKRGDKLKREHIDFRRPGHGVIRPDNYKYYIGRSFAKNLDGEHMLESDDLN